MHASKIKTAKALTANLREGHILFTNTINITHPTLKTPHISKNKTHPSKRKLITSSHIGNLLTNQRIIAVINPITRDSAI